VHPSRNVPTRKGKKKRTDEYWQGGLGSNRAESTGGGELVVCEGNRGCVFGEKGRHSQGNKSNSLKAVKAKETGAEHGKKSKSTKGGHWRFMG